MTPACPRRRTTERGTRCGRTPGRRARQPRRPTGRRRPTVRAPERRATPSAPPAPTRHPDRSAARSAVTKPGQPCPASRAARRSFSSTGRPLGSRRHEVPCHSALDERRATGGNLCNSCMLCPITREHTYGEDSRATGSEGVVAAQGPDAQQPEAAASDPRGQRASGRASADTSVVGAPLRDSGHRTQRRWPPPVLGGGGARAPADARRNRPRTKASDAARAVRAMLDPSDPQAARIDSLIAASRLHGPRSDP